MNDTDSSQPPSEQESEVNADRHPEWSPAPPPAGGAGGKIFIVDRGFQVRLALRGAAVGLVSSLFGFAVIWYPLDLFERLPMGTSLPMPVYGFMAFAVLANIAAIVAFGIRISHRISGPVYSIVRHMRKVEKGQKVTLLQARHSDELKYLVRNYNNLLVGLDLARQGQIETLNQVHETLARIKRDGLPVGDTSAVETLAQLERLIGRLGATGLESVPSGYLKESESEAAPEEDSDRHTPAA